MAVRRPFTVGFGTSTADSAEPLADPAEMAATKSLDRAQARATHLVDDSAPAIWISNLHLMRSGAALLAVYEAAYFIADYFVPPAFTPLSIALHLGTLGVSALVLMLTFSDLFESIWHIAWFASLLAIYCLTLTLRLITGDTQAVLITLMLTQIGAAALLSWSARWQVGLSAAALATTIVPSLVRETLMHERVDPQSVYRWMGVLFAALAGYLILLIRREHAEGLAAWMENLRKSHRELASALAHNARIMAERETAQRLVCESEQTLRRIFEASPDSMTIKRLTDERYIEVNRAFEDICYTREETLGKTAEELNLWVDPGHHKAYLEKLKAERRVRNLEFEFRARDGRIVPALLSAVVVELGGESCVISIVRDISEIKRVEQDLIAAREALSAQVKQLSRTQEALRAEIAERELAQRRVQDSEQTLRRIFETSLDAITVNRWPDMTFVDLNQHHVEIFGIPKEQALSAPPRAFRLWAHADQFRQYLREMQAYGFVQNMEVDFILRDGSHRPFLCSSTLAELNGELCVVSALRDISRLKQTERALISAREEALAASEAKSHFLSVMSHEIRTPMNAILGMADLLWDTPLNAEQRRYVDTMRSNGAALLNLVNSILDLSKIESGRLILDHSDFDLGALAEDVMETMAVRAHEKGLELALRISSGLPGLVTGDPLRLRQILINLIGNAIKFTERGEVMLSVEPDSDVSSGESARAHQRLRFVVRDTGIGIPAEKQKVIFSKFAQADPSISRRFGGSGLGLAIVKRLVELMNGSITVESRVGEGSVFSFTVALERQARGWAAQSPPIQLAGKRMLVADHSPAVRNILLELLELTGAQVDLAADGTAALSEILRARTLGRPYDVCMIDSAIPGFDGPALAQESLRAKQDKHEALVLMLTANDLNGQLRRLRSGGLRESPQCRYLVKPVRRPDLWSTLIAVCSDMNGATATVSGSPSTDGETGSCNHHGASCENAAAYEHPIIKKPLEILLAEDSPDARLLVEAYLKNTPCRLDQAENGEIAVNKFATGHYDVILMDIEMPVMDGYEAMAEIRRQERCDHRRPTPIIALTASAQDENARRSLKMGCEAHLIKPVKRSTLLETISQAVTPDSSAAEASGDESSRQPIVVEIDDDLNSLVPGFLSRKREEARAVVAAAEQRDSEAISRLGHKMKGEGGSYGFDAITDLGRELEQAGKNSDFDAARRLGEKLTDFLERLEIIYRPSED